MHKYLTNTKTRQIKHVQVKQIIKNIAVDILIILYSTLEPDRIARFVTDTWNKPLILLLFNITIYQYLQNYKPYLNSYMP